MDAAAGWQRLVLYRPMQGAGRDSLQGVAARSVILLHLDPWGFPNPEGLGLRTRLGRRGSVGLVRSVSLDTHVRSKVEGLRSVLSVVKGLNTSRNQASGYASNQLALARHLEPAPAPNTQCTATRNKEIPMETKVTPDATYAPSQDVVAREIEGELIIVPMVAGMGDTDDELFTLNETGRAIWDRLDGQRSLKDLVVELSADFEATEGEIKADVLGLVAELARRKMVIVV